MDQVKGQSQRLGHNQISKRRLLVILIIVGLAGLVWLAFGGTLRHEFLNYDDNEYVYENPQVAAGLSVNGILWAFTHTYAANWHPLTAISHMLDCQIYGLHPWGHHLTNVVLHALGAILLFLALLKLTGPMVALDQRRPAKMRAAVSSSAGLPDTIWPSAFVAALFAIHPLRVESVAWISERKDVLSGVFFMLTLLAYASYVKNEERPLKSYLTTILLFALGLLCKPTLVTLPFVLLLLDYWPLGRMQSAKGEERRGKRKARGAKREVRSGNEETMPAFQHFSISGFSGLVIEKVPFFILSVASCVATVIAQSRALELARSLTLPQRLVNAVLSYNSYLAQLFYPARLAVMYPYPSNVSVLYQFLPAFLLLLVISILFFRWRTKYPFLLVGWLWFLGTLVPMIGLMQVGSQAHADRYTYLTQIGLYILITWAAMIVFGKSRAGRIFLTTLGLLVVSALTVLSRQDASAWKDTITLWNQALTNTSNNAIAHNNLGHALTLKKEFAPALSQFREAIRLRSDYAEAYNNLANALLDSDQVSQRGKPVDPEHITTKPNDAVLNEAIENYKKALAVKPSFADAWTNLGTALMQKGEMNEAIADYQKALEIAPDLPEANGNFGNALLQTGKLDEAIDYYQRALRLKPNYADADYGVSLALLQQGKSSEALEHLQRVLFLEPDYPEAYHNMGVILAQKGQLGSAIEHYEKAIQLKPNYAQAENNLGNALLRQGRPDGAIVHLRNAVNIEPDYAEAYNDLGSAFMQKNQVDQAITYYQKAIQLRQNYAVAHSNLGNALLQKKDFDGAILQDKAALNFKPDSAPMHYNLGNAQAAKGNFADAISSYQAALQIQPNYVEVHNRLGLTLVALKENDRAIEEFARALEINPQFADAHCNLGRLLAQLGRRDEAVAQFSEALRLRPNYADAKEQLRKLGVNVTQ